MQPRRLCRSRSESVGISAVNVLFGYVYLFMFKVTQQITNSKALRVVLLGPRAIDGKNKRKRSQSRIKRFAVTVLSESLLSFVATVVCLSKQLAILNTDRTKLFFLLDDSTTFSEDNERFRTFFENRYLSLTVHLRKKLPGVLRETMTWLNNEVFVSQDNEEEAKLDERQCAFEDALEKEINEASEIFRREREDVVAELRHPRPL